APEPLRPPDPTAARRGFLRGPATTPRTLLQVSRLNSQGSILSSRHDTMRGLTSTNAVKTAAVFAAIMAIAWHRRRTHHPFSRFGPANQITTLRALIVAVIAGFIGEPADRMAIGAAVATAGGLAATALDGVDGWL